MIKLRNILFAITLVICGIFVGACGTTVSADQTWPLKIWAHNTNGKMETYCLVDEDTGVNYIVVSGELGGRAMGTSITPRLNADGSLYVE